ncbi:hypothetical protein AHAS_Ahas01G0190500 [Arachis hypogaea]
MLFGHIPPCAHHLSHLIHTSSASILPQPSLFLMLGEARYQWKHEINHKPGYKL